ncbi:MAG: hypothetical protein ACLP50_07755 [Solirubrobacteraceae bacterium]
MSTSATTITLIGTVDPAGQTTTYHVNYDLHSSAWCESLGYPGTYPANTTPAQTLDASGAGVVAVPGGDQVTVQISGLQQGVGYCMQLTATNASGTASGMIEYYTAGAPSTYTDWPVQSAGSTSVTLTGTVNPAGQSTTYDAEYDLSSSGWCRDDGQTGTPSYTTPAENLGAADTSDHRANVTITGLQTGAQYCARLNATNASANSSDTANTDSASTESFIAGQPMADTSAAHSTGLTTAIVTGTVNPSGQSTTYTVRYDRQSTQWCQTHGTLGSPSYATSPQTLGATDAASHTVSVNLTGLAPGARYCVQVIATNASASISGLVEPVTAATSQSAPTRSPASARLGRPATTAAGASVRVSCAGSANQTCAISMRLVVETSKRKTIVLGAATITIAAGRSTTVVLRLNAAGESLLAARHSVAAQLAATCNNKPLPSATVSL